MTILTHADLDGIVAAMCVKACYPGKWINTVATGYLSLSKKIDQLNEKETLLILDLNLNEEQINAVIAKSIKTVAYFDHHETVKYVADKIKENNFKHIIDKSRCGAKITYDFFKKVGNIKYLEELVELTNIYDIWQENHPRFDEAMLLNDLYWYLGISKFQSEFEHGYDNNICKSEKNQFKKEKEIFMKESFDNYTTIENSTVFVNDPRMQHISYYTIFKPDFKFYFILKTLKDEFAEFAVRIRNSDLTILDINEEMRKHFPEIGIGGHLKSGGVKLPIEKINDFFECFVIKFDK